MTATATIRSETRPGEVPAPVAATAGGATVFSPLAALLKPRLSAAAVVLACEPLARRTTLKVGGPADVYVEPAGETDLAEVLRFCRDRAVPVRILGRGSNLLVRDGGVRGVVVCLAALAFAQVEVQGPLLRAGAGARLKQVAAEARRHALTGLEFLEGIPGSVGGALRMNAGAHQAWTFGVLERVRWMTPEGEAEEKPASAVPAEYRSCPAFRTNLALAAVFRGQPGDEAAIQARMEAFRRQRQETQPREASAGCIFKNPATIPAGRLIDELGLKGTRIGGAQVSTVHGNFIVNTGGATAAEVLELIEWVRVEARAKRAVELETEVEIVGEDSV